MKLVNGLRALALTAFIFSSSSCTSDGSEETVEAVEEDNQVPSPVDDAIDTELPSAEAASSEAEQGTETIDQNSEAEVEALSSEQQIAVDEAAEAGLANGAGQEIAAVPVPGAEDVSATDNPVESAALPETPVEQAPALIASPELPAEDSAPAIPTIADIVAESETAHANSAAPEAKNHKRMKSKRAPKAPILNANEKMYIVQPGDTLARIANLLFGASREWKSLADLNGIDQQGLIFPGDAIKYVPSDKTAAFEARYDGLPKASVSVEKGDTLSKIATRVMGDPSYWKMLWRWNEASVPDPNQIAIGMSLQYVTKQDLDGASSAAAH